MLKVGRCPLWVKSGHSLTFGRCLLYRQKRTLIERVGMSALCHVWTAPSWQGIFTSANYRVVGRQSWRRTVYCYQFPAQGDFNYHPEVIAKAGSHTFDARN